MNNIRMILSLAAVSALLLNACNTSSDIHVGHPCSLDSECGDLVCVSNVCIDKCTPTSCDPGQVCNERGICTASSEPINPQCSANNPCPTGKICQNGVCVVPQHECSSTVPCADLTKICDVSTSKCIDRCTAQSCGNDKICDVSGLCVDKCTSESCGTGFICMNGYCIASCTENSCPSGQFCGADGICVTACTPSSCTGNQVCSASTGKCEAKCSHGSCPAGQVCADSGSCVSGECSTIDPCSGDKICSQGKCYTVTTLTCYEDEDCGEGYGCDNQKCVDENSCSLTRTCADGKICRNGWCSDPISVACDSKTPCKDASKKCIAGQCVTCSCGANETCVGDNKCVPSNTAGDYKVGDICTWSKDFQHCDNNRIVSCTSEIGSDEFNVNISDCGARVCAETSDDLGASCHEACAQEGDFYGVCLDFSSELDEFTQLCEKTADDKLVWTLSNGYKTCTSSCTNGRCNFVPAEFGESCTESNYPDACQGRWLTYCYYNYKMGTDCRTYSDEHFCALPSSNALKLNSQLIGTCALECTTPGATHRECIQDEEGNVYSMNYLCAETKDGKLADFEAGYVNCEKGCNVPTGLCL